MGCQSCNHLFWTCAVILYILMTSAQIKVVFLNFIVDFLLSFNTESFVVSLSFFLCYIYVLLIPLGLVAQ
ncbi:hypothetical protein L1987_11872 [Smallanthus sonchifolius]|uniref:Uncharacterized protein n=1 Tax=Smallanthus sonchifolius TaxID=185202 RepID=A0ACB9JCR3_9ASTR|nr:hypothetical protein L1987_11872 [Smallanthus sonchifolius]